MAVAHVAHVALLDAVPQVLVVGSGTADGVYGRIAECAFHARFVRADLADLGAAEIEASDVVVMACSERALVATRFRLAVARVTRLRPVVAVVPNPTPHAGAHAAELGLRGVVASTVSPRAFERTIQAAHAGELAIPRSSVAPLLRMLGRLSARALVDVGGEPLTPRQHQIVQLIAQGATDAEIAELLGISQSTAHKHVQNARRKAHARTRSQLVAHLHARPVPEGGRP